MAIAEKLIRINDKAKAEVLVDVEILIMANVKKLGHRHGAVDLQFQRFRLARLVTDGTFNPDAPNRSPSASMNSGPSPGSDWFVNVPSAF